MSKIIRQSIRKGLLFAIIMIFIMMIGFHAITATLVSKAFGVNVLRGAIPEVRFMLITHVLFGIWAGWSAASKNGKKFAGILEGTITGFSAGFFIALFGLLLNWFIQSGTEVREYLSQLSVENMSYFLLDKGWLGSAYLLILYTVTGFAGSLLAVIMRSDKAKNYWETLKSTVSKTITRINDSLPSVVRNYGKYVFYAVLLIALFILPSRWGSYMNFVIGLVGLYVIAGIGLNIIVGLSGQLVLGYAAFFAMGAYSVALLNTEVPHNLFWGFWPAIVLAIVMAVIAAVFLGLPTMRLRGDYLAIVTLGFGEIIRILLKSDLLTDYTGGPRGLMSIAGPTLFGKPFSSDSDFVYIIFVGVVLAIFLFNRLQDSRTGRAWLAIKEDPIAAQATGVNLQRHKLLALCIGAAFAGLVGGISAARNQFTGPNDHSLMVSMNVLSILIVGGVNSIPGIILGAFTLKGLPEILREVENYRQLAFGVLLVVMMLMRPDGLWPSSRPLIEQEDCSPVDPDNSSEGGKNA